MLDLTQIIVAILTLIGIIITSVVVPYYKSKTTAEQQAKVDYWLRIFIAAAETAYTEQGMGEKKKKQVLDNITEWAEKHGIKIDIDEILVAIDGLCRELTASKVIN